MLYDKIYNYDIGRSIMIDKIKEQFRNFDFPLFVAVILLTVIGIILVASATSSMASGMRYVIIQSAALILGIAACFVMAFWDYEYLASKSYYLFGLNILALVIVLIIGTGAEEWGGKSWIRFGPIGIQPSELVKISFIICLASQLAQFKEELNRPSKLIWTLLHIGVILGLILLQPDMGTAMVFAAIYAGMLFAAKLDWKYIVSTVALFLFSLPLLWMFVLKEYQKERIRVFLNPSLDPQGSGYQVLQSKLAIGSGQIAGDGLFSGMQIQMGNVPAKHTDFIFAVAGEELGFIGCCLIVGIIIFIIARCFYIGLNAKNSLGGFMAVGVGMMLLAQSFENIGMTIGIMPVTGITLPFLSYGGSSIVTNFIAIGLVLNICRRRKVIDFR